MSDPKHDEPPHASTRSAGGTTAADGTCDADGTAAAEVTQPEPENDGALTATHGTATAGEHTLPLDEQADRPRLVPSKKAPAEAQELVLEENCEVVGRGPSAGLRITWDGHVSNIHAQIERREDDWLITDLDAKNPTEVNKERIEGPRVIHDGDVIKLGQYAYVFHTRRPAGKRGRTVLLGIAACLLVIIVGATLAPRRDGGPAVKEEASQQKLVREIYAVLSTLRLPPEGAESGNPLASVDQLIAQIRNPETRQKLQGLRDDITAALARGKEIEPAARQIFSDPSPTVLRDFRKVVATFCTHADNVTAVKEIPEDSGTRLLVKGYANTADMCEKAVSLSLRLGQAAKLDTKLQVLREVDQWRHKHGGTALAKFLGQKADAVAGQELEQALRRFDLDTADKLVQCVSNRYLKRDHGQRLKREALLVQALQGRTRDWYAGAEIQRPSHPTVLRALLELIGAARERHHKLLRLVRQQTEQEFLKETADTGKLLSDLKASETALDQLTQEIRSFPGSDPPPAALRFLQEYQRPAMEWELPSTRLRALLKRWQPFRNVVRVTLDAEAATPAQFRQAAEEGRHVHLTIAAMTDDVFQSLVPRLGAVVDRLVKPCVHKARQRAEAEARPAEQVAFLRAMLHFNWCRDAETVSSLEWARARIVAIEREGKEKAILAYLHYRLGDDEEADLAAEIARRILGEQHPWMQKLKP